MILEVDLKCDLTHEYLCYVSMKCILFIFCKEQLPEPNDIFMIIKLKKKTLRFNNKVLHFGENVFVIWVWQIGASKEKYDKCGLAY